MKSPAFTTLRLALLAAFLPMSVAAAPVRSLFSPEPFSHVDIASDMAGRAMADDPAVRNMRQLRVDHVLVDPATPDMSLDLGDGVAHVATRVRSYETPGGASVWIGSLPSRMPVNDLLRASSGKGLDYDARNHVMLVSHDGKVTGNLHVDGQLYRLRPLDDGGHVLAAVDTTKLPTLSHDDAPLHPDSHKPAEPAGMLSPAQSLAATTIRVIVVYGPAAQRQTNNYMGLAELAIARANEGFVTSQIDLRFELAVIYNGLDEESGNLSYDLERITDDYDGFMDFIHNARNEFRADLVTLVSGNSGGGCGIAWLNPGPTHGFSAIGLGCFQGDNVFAHEAGHNLGATHDPETAQGDTGAYSYGFGFRDRSVQARTVMAYQCEAWSCETWLPLWSSPVAWYGGVQMGNGWKSDNRRVLIERKETVARFR